MSELQTSTVQDFFPFYAIGHQPSPIFGFLCPLILFSTKPGHKCFFRHWEYQTQLCRQSIFSYDCLPAITLCWGWPVMCNLTTMLENIIPKVYLFLLFFAFEPPGNSPNCRMAGEEFWRGNNNGIVAPKIRMKMGTEIWKMNILYKFEKRLNCISISISIKFSWNGKIQDTIMYYHYDRKIRYLSHWSKSFIAVMSSSSHCNSFLQFSRESKSVWSPGF